MIIVLTWLISFVLTCLTCISSPSWMTLTCVRTGASASVRTSRCTDSYNYEQYRFTVICSVFVKKNCSIGAHMHSIVSTQCFYYFSYGNSWLNHTDDNHCNSQTFGDNMHLLERSDGRESCRIMLVNENLIKAMMQRNVRETCHVLTKWSIWWWFIKARTQACLDLLNHVQQLLSTWNKVSGYNKHSN